MPNLLVVCLGNYCRSPFAQLALARRGGPHMAVRSAGLIGKWQDQPAHSAMVNAARRLGYDLTAHRAQQISLDMLEWADKVLAMDASVLATPPGRLRSEEREQTAPLPRRPGRARPDGPGRRRVPRMRCAH